MKDCNKKMNKATGYSGVQKLLLGAKTETPFPRNEEEVSQFICFGNFDPSILTFRKVLKLSFSNNQLLISRYYISVLKQEASRQIMGNDLFDSEGRSLFCMFNFL